MSGPFAGVDFDAVFTAGTRATRFPPFSLGQQMQDADGNVYVWVQANGAITGAGYVCTFDEAGQAVMTTNAASLYGDRVGVAKAAFADNDYGWLQVYGPASVRAGALCAANAPINTINTGGTIDDGAGTGTKVIVGLALTTTNGAEIGNAPAVLNYPVIGATN